MKIVIATDKFKGSLSATQACDAIERGVRRALPRAKITKVPLADGGEGTVQTLVAATGGKLVSRRVTGPLGAKVRATFGLIDGGKTAVIEMAAASGLSLVPPSKRNPLVTTTYGTGELIEAALCMGARRLILGIGGSATNDGGSGMAVALGAKLLDRRGRRIGLGGGALSELDRIDLSEFRVQKSKLTVSVACDVTNPLCGPRGASAAYGPQKGATPRMVEILDRNLARYAKIVQGDVLTGANFEARSWTAMPGAGAAGGLGFGLCAFLGAKMVHGIDLVLDHVTFDEKIRSADLIITGEGAIDEQTVKGKVIMGVARRARKHGVPVIALAGTVPPSANAVFAYGIRSVVSICHSPMSLPSAMENARSLLTLATDRALRLVNLAGAR